MCLPGVKPRSGHLFHQRRKFQRMTIMDAINTHNGDRGFFKAWQQQKHIPWWCGGGASLKKETVSGTLGF